MNNHIIKFSSVITSYSIHYTKLYEADSYISKPFNIDVLKANVRSLVANREQLRLRFQNEIKINPDLV